MAWEKFFSRGKVSEESRVMYNLCLKRASSIGLAKFISTDGQMSLEDSFKAYERAAKLRDRLNAILDESDKRIQVLTEAGEQPLDAGEEL